MPAGWYEYTEPESLEVFLQLHRQMTPSQRVARVFELTAFQESLQRASVRAMYPHAGEREVSCARPPADWIATPFFRCTFGTWI